MTRVKWVSSRICTEPASLTHFRSESRDEFWRETRALTMHLFGARHWPGSRGRGHRSRDGETQVAAGRGGRDGERELIKTRLYPCWGLEMLLAARASQVRVLFLISIITLDVGYILDPTPFV